MSGRKQKVKAREPINKGKILGGKRETFQTEGRTQESKVKKKEGGKEKEEKKINHQMMKSKNYQYENEGRSLNEMVKEG